MAREAIWTPPRLSRAQADAMSPQDFARLVISPAQAAQVTARRFEVNYGLMPRPPMEEVTLLTRPRFVGDRLCVINVYRIHFRADDFHAAFRDASIPYTFVSADEALRLRYLPPGAQDCGADDSAYGWFSPDLGYDEQGAIALARVFRWVIDTAAGPSRLPFETVCEGSTACTEPRAIIAGFPLDSLIQMRRPGPRIVDDYCAPGDRRGRCFIISTGYPGFGEPCARPCAWTLTLQERGGRITSVTMVRSEVRPF